MSEWKKVRLGEVAEFLNGKSKPKEPGIIPIYGSNGVIGFSNRSLYANAIIVGRVGAYAGSIARCKTDFWPTDNTIIVKPRDGQVDIDFVFYRLQKLSLSSLLGGSAQPLITHGILKDKEFSLPPLPTQRRIAAVLSSLDDKIENNRKICANLEAQAQAIFKSWFVDFEPFGGKMPQGWKMEPLEGMAERIASGGTPRTKEESYYKGLIRWYSTKELKDCYLFDSEKHISEDAVANSAAKVFPRNTILMAIYAAPTVGRLGILDSESTFNQAAVGIVARREIGYAYLYLQLLNAREGLNLMAVGSCQQNLNVGVVKSYQILRPDNVILTKFNNLVDGLFDEIRALTKESRALAALRDALLPKLMSGEIDVEKVKISA